MNQLTFGDGTFAGKTIRTTSDGYGSIYDIMRVAGVGTDPTNVWKNLKPHFLDSGTTDSRQPTVKTFKFAGRGQRDTPVINRRGLMRLLFLLPGINARKFIAESAETQQTPVNVESVMDDVEMMDEPVETDDSETDEIPTEIVTGGNGFETNRAGDLVYCMEWAKREAERKKMIVHQTEHPNRGLVVGIVDLMNLFGGYNQRDTAATQWRKIKIRNTARPFGSGDSLPDFHVKYKVNNNWMDHCTIPDFFDKVLSHITGPVADAIKRARSNTATLVFTGSQMAVDQTRANAESVMNAGADIQLVAENVREQAEQSAVEDGSVPVEIMSSRGLATADEKPPKYRVIYKDVPPGPKLYRRVSQQRYDPDIDVPASSKLQPGDIKIGINRTNLNQRNSGYVDDFGTRSDRDVEQMERVVKGAIHPFTTQNSTEYFNPEKLLQSKKLDSNECDPADRAWKYCYDALATTEINSINGVYDSEVVVDARSEQTHTNDGLDNTNHQKRIDDYFNTPSGNRASVVLSEDKSARTITVRFKRADGGFENDVEIQKASQNIDLRRMDLEFEIEKYKIDAELKKTALEMFKNDTEKLGDFWKILMAQR